MYWYIWKLCLKIWNRFILVVGSRWTRQPDAGRSNVKLKDFFFFLKKARRVFNISPFLCGLRIKVCNLHNHEILIYPHPLHFWILIPGLFLIKLASKRVFFFFSPPCLRLSLIFFFFPLMWIRIPEQKEGGEWLGSNGDCSLLRLRKGLYSTKLMLTKGRYNAKFIFLYIEVSSDNSKGRMQINKFIKIKIQVHHFFRIASKLGVYTKDPRNS